LAIIYGRDERGSDGNCSRYSSISSGSVMTLVFEAPNEIDGEPAAYLWEMRMHYYLRYGDSLPWGIFKPLPQ
jgi:hypothetical protein